MHVLKKKGVVISQVFQAKHDGILVVRWNGPLAQKQLTSGVCSSAIRDSFLWFYNNHFPSCVRQHTYIRCQHVLLGQIRW